MSGQAFGAFAQGLSGGYRTMDRAQARGVEHEEPYQSSIERMAKGTTFGGNRMAEMDDESTGTRDIKSVTNEQIGLTWDLIRRMNARKEGSPEQEERAPEQSSSQSSLNSNSMNTATSPASSMSNGIGSGGGSSALVTGGPGTGTAASYAPNGFGLAGASQGLTYGGSALGSSAGMIGSAAGATSGAASGGASFGLGGSLVGGTGTVGGSTFAAGAGSSAAGGGSAAGGAAAGGPWALLAAAVIANETSARKAGRRNENKGKHAMDLVSGKVLEQDMDYYGDKVGGLGGNIIKVGGQMGNPEGVFNLVKKIFK